MNKKFIASYSGGKDSALAIYRAISKGYELMGLLTTYNTDKERSWFHGIPDPLLKEIGKSMGVPHILIKTSGPDYTENFETALKAAKTAGADFCVFGDIDIAGHKTWDEERCRVAGLHAVFPLWDESREALVAEFIDSGFTAHITVTDLSRMPGDFLGKVLCHPVAAEIAETGADICGENGEYHTFVSNGPFFSHPVPFIFGEKLTENGYGILPVLPAV